MAKLPKQALRRKATLGLFTNTDLRLYRSLSIALVLCSVFGCRAQTPKAPDWAERLDALIQKGVDDNHIPGLAYVIVENGQLAHAKGFGYATLGQAAVTPDTVFHLASVTKPFVATAIMQLVEQGKDR
jgi:CubicO group peptidase (beta-lactamase class C family)